MVVGERRNDVLLNAELLQGNQLEKVSDPEYVLDDRKLQAGLQDQIGDGGARIDEVKYHSEAPCGGPKGKENSDLGTILLLIECQLSQ